MAELEIGTCKATIESHGLRVYGNNDVVELTCTTDYDAPCRVAIFLTEKSMGIARKQLKMCGFDVDSRDVGDLDEEPTLLQGREIPVLIEEYKGKLQAKVNMNRGVEKHRRGSITSKLRAAKKEGEPEFDEEDNLPF